MTTTSNYGITLLEAAQAQKEVTINEALAIIDAALKGAVLDKDLAIPPGSPIAGDAYIVAASPTGAWSGKAKSIAYFDSVWRFITPQTNMRVWVSDESATYMYNGTAWAISTVSSITGNAATATALQTARTINGVSFDGTANITISASADAGLLTGTTLASGVVNSSLTSVGTIATGTWNATAIAANKGGTGQTSYTTGDILYASSSSALSKLADVATGNALISGGTSTAPSWGKIGLTTHVSGILPVANGGTNNAFFTISGPATSAKTYTVPNASCTLLTDNAAVTAGQGGTGQTIYTTGDILYASSSSALSKLADVATGNALISGGTSTAPSWGKIGLTTHVSGTLPVANGGTGDTGTAWTSYTPTVSAGSGTFTSVSATGRYKTIGKTTFIQIAVTITTNGTAASNVQATLPSTAAGFHYALNGRETNSTGLMLNAVVFSGTNLVYITKYDNTYIGANGYVLSVCGVYEAA